MAEQKEMRLSLAAKKLNVGIVTIVEKLAVKGIRIDNNPNYKLNLEQLNILSKEYNSNSLLDDKISTLSIQDDKKLSENSDILYFRQQAKVDGGELSEISGVTILGKIDLDKKTNSSPVLSDFEQKNISDELINKLSVENDKSYKVALEKIQKYKKTGQGNTLNLSDLDLDSIPKELTQLTKLKKIQLSNNRISEIENLPQNVNEVELNNNLILKISNLPKNVTILKINYNRLSFIDKLPNSIQVLEATNNQVEKIVHLPLSLKKIKLNNNHLKTIEFPIHIESIAICNNQLENLIPIESYKKLSELYLYGNPIKGIRPEIFGEQDNYNCFKGLKSYLIEYGVPQ